MHKSKILNVVLFSLLFVVLISNNIFSQPQITITKPMSPPSWALAEQSLLEENARFLQVFVDRYVNPVTGHLECVEHWGGADGPDDAMENFYNWSLLYALGAPRSTLNLFNFVWRGHIDQYSKLGMLYREYITSFDWEHNGEQYASFLLLPLSDPEDLRTQQRIIRFADFYTGRDTTTHNYDPIHKIIPSIHNGSKGPRMTATVDDWGGQDFWWKTGDWTQVKGDVPMNLCATSLAVNAYMLTGDEHYKNWVLDYVSAWRERTITNNGIVPSNIGVNGIVGEHWDGKWYGGLMGWNWSFGGFGVLGRGVRIGFNNAYFLSHDQSYLDVLRKLGDVLMKNRIQTPAGLLFPNRYGDNGWYDPSSSPLFGSLFADIYMWSLGNQDLEQLYSACQLQGVLKSGKYEEGNEVAWIEFLKGKNPDYPQRALNDAFERIRSGVEGLRRDTSTPDTRNSDEPQQFSTAATSALVNLTLGGAQPLWAGGLLFSQVRYFDPVQRRPGLPSDVSALVHKIENDMVQVTLVNCNKVEPREIIVQTGAYGENQCLRIEIDGKQKEINNRFFSLRLEPGAGNDVVIHLRRFANKPTFAFPF